MTTEDEKGGRCFSDDGEEIDPLSVPLPPLCTSCLRHTDTWEETPCLLNRVDQMKGIRRGEKFAVSSMNQSIPL